MSDKPLISVIVPVYKAERYLPRCIESILKQTYTNFELILVDDGTTDRSGIICDRYAEKDSRIRVIHKENGGVSTARNVGIDAAKGKWITFVDSDDWVSDNCLQILIDPTFEYEYDFVIGSLEIRELKISRSVLKTNSYIYCNDNVETVIELISMPRFHGPVAKMYKSHILQENNIRFIEGVKDGEDKIFVVEYLKYCHSIKTTESIVYFYNRFEGYLKAKKLHYVKELPYWIEKYLQSFTDLCSIYGANDEFKNAIVSRIASAHLQTYLNNCAKRLGAFEAKEAMKAAIDVLLPWIELEKRETNQHLLEKGQKPDYTNIDAIYKKYNKKKMLRNGRRLVRVFLIKLFGNAIEKKRDSLIRKKSV